MIKDLDRLKNKTPKQQTGRHVPSEKPEDYLKQTAVWKKGKRGLHITNAWVPGVANSGGERGLKQGYS